MSGFGARPSAELGVVFAEIAKLVMTAGGAEFTLQEVVTYAARAVSGIDHAGLTLVRGRTAPQTVASTSEVSARLDALQYEVGEGPCLDALSENDYCRCDDLTAERRWPSFLARAVAETSVRSMLGVRVRLDGEYRASLNLYSESPSRTDEVDLAVATMFATHLSALLRRDLATERSATLEFALTSSRQIGAAMGILMARELMTFDEAFDQLRAASQRLHRKLRDVADDVVERGELPG